VQDALRDKFKEMGFRVFMAGDPIRALDRFRQQPYDALVIDAGTTGEEGLVTFERVLLEANRQRVLCASILILSEDQADWAHRIAPAPSLAVLVRPVTLKQLKHKLEELLPHAEHDSSNGKKP
jgi:DNA-binding response OmpR family regulator